MQIDTLQKGRGERRFRCTIGPRIFAINQSFLVDLNFIRIAKMALKILKMLNLLRRNFKNYFSSSEIRVMVKHQKN